MYVVQFLKVEQVVTTDFHFQNHKQNLKYKLTKKYRFSR